MGQITRGKMVKKSWNEKPKKVCPFLSSVLHPLAIFGFRQGLRMS